MPGGKKPSITTSSTEQQQLLLRQFPALGTVLVTNEEYAGTDARSLFDLFLSDDAPHPLPLFHAERGDSDISVTAWRDVGPADAPFRAGEEERAPAAARTRERRLRFCTTKKGPFPFGRVRVCVVSRQRATLLGDRVCCVRFRTTLENVPYADSFCVWSTWRIRTESRPQDYIHGGSTRNSRNSHTEGSNMSGSDRNNGWKRLRGFIGLGNSKNTVTMTDNTYLDATMETEMLRKNGYEQKIHDLAFKMMHKFLDSWIEWTQTMHHLGSLRSTQRSGTQNDGPRRRTTVTGSSATHLLRRRLLLHRTFRHLSAPHKRKGERPETKRDRTAMQKLFFSKQTPALHEACKRLRIDTDTEGSSRGGSHTGDSTDAEEVCLAVREHEIEAYLRSVSNVSWEGELNK